MASCPFTVKDVAVVSLVSQQLFFLIKRRTALPEDDWVKQVLFFFLERAYFKVDAKVCLWIVSETKRKEQFYSWFNLFWLMKVGSHCRWIVIIISLILLFFSFLVHNVTFFGVLVTFFDGNNMPLSLKIVTTLQ